MNNNLKKGLTHVAAICLFIILVLIYFAPAIFEGKVILQGDTQRAMGMSQELYRYYMDEGENSAWTGSMFSGMPSYHIQVYGNPPNYLFYLEAPVKAIDYNAGSIMLVSLLCFYILMCVMGMNRWLAIAGSIAFTFASYSIIIIVAGHVTKAYVMAYMTLTVAGLILLFRRKWFWGGLVLVLGIAFSLINSHIQITYYLAIFCAFLFLGLFVREIKEKKYVDLGKITGIIIVCLILGVLPNLGSLYSNYEVAQASMRGPSELTQQTDNKAEKVSSGLDKEYAFQWSYGKTELLTLLIPNVYGGETGGVLDRNSAFYKEMKALGQQLGKEINAPTYWGDQPFTGGPVYLGAVVCLLFVLGMIVIKNPIKWWIAGGTLFFILLALGRHLDWFNDFMFHHLPMYNKFRVPPMSLVIPAMSFPVIGIWGLKEIFDGKVHDLSLKKAIIWSVSIVGIICLAIWLIPGLFLNFESPYDVRFQSGWPESLYNALLKDRQSLASSDAFRSLVFIILGGILLFYYLKIKDKKQGIMIVGIGVLVLIFVDLWTIDKRYLNNSVFKKEKLTDVFKKSPADEEILKDKDPSYRVLDMNDPFQNANPSYYHKSIGGYHAAKLRRYQELIDHRLSKEITGYMGKAQTIGEMVDAFEQCNSLNMLNMKYVIFNPAQPPIRNPYAYGNAWFVDEYKVVENADAEILSLETIKPLKTAVIDKRFAGELLRLSIVPDSTAWIRLESYKPNILVYSSQAASEQLAVFSEIYYEKGWKAYIDGERVPYFRVDWTLRGMRVPAGEHTIEFRFIPDVYNKTIMISSVSSGVVLLLLIVAVGFSFWEKKKKRNSIKN
jgi:hypothetical protein